MPDIAAPPETRQEALFPIPLSMTGPLHERVTGYTFTGRDGEIIRYLSPLSDPSSGDGCTESCCRDVWVFHPWGQWESAYRYYIPSYCHPAASMLPSEIGPSPRDCSIGCAYIDGCPVCWPERWQDCPDGYCYQGRVPISSIPDGAPCQCYEQCVECQDWHPARLIYGADIDGVEDQPVCRFCRSHFEYCDPHGVYYRGEGHGDCVDEDDPLDPYGRCTDSCCRDNNGGDVISYYSYRPMLQFKGDGPLYLGLEAEINTGSHDRVSVARSIADEIDGIAYMKDDSSIGNGFELVTHPMQFEWAMQNFPWDIFGKMRSNYGLSNHAACGIHVHVSRAGFTDHAHAYRWLKWFYRNSVPITQLSRRKAADLEEWADFRSDVRPWSAYHAKYGARDGRVIPWLERRNRQYGNDHGDPAWSPRYSAVNVLNDETYEVRVFAGSVYQTQVQAALGLVHASVEYTRRLTTRDILKHDGWGWRPFTKYIADNPLYASLRSEIERLVTVCAS